MNWTYKALTFAPVGGDELASGTTRASLRQLTATGANAVAFVPTWYQTNVNSPTIYRTENTSSDASLITAIGEARVLGLKVMLKPHLASLDGQWRAHINPCSINQEPCPASNSLASQWFSRYDAMMDHYATLGKQQKVNQLDIGSELIDMSTNSAYARYWFSLIRDLRFRFQGSLTYSANWGAGSYATEYTRIKFWNALDYIGISAYFPLSNSNSPSVSDMIATWQNTWLPQIRSFHQQYNKPVLFSEIGYRSASIAALAPFDYSLGSADLQQQANCYEATLNAWANISWFAGVAFWDWSANPHISGGNTDYTVQNKPAYNILALGFGSRSALESTPTPTTSTPPASATLSASMSATSVPTTATIPGATATLPPGSITIP